MLTRVFIITTLLFFSSCNLDETIRPNVESDLYGAWINYANVIDNNRGLIITEDSIFGIRYNLGAPPEYYLYAKGIHFISIDTVYLNPQDSFKIEIINELEVIMRRLNSPNLIVEDYNFAVQNDVLTLTSQGSYLQDVYRKSEYTLADVLRDDL